LIKKAAAQVLVLSLVLFFRETLQPEKAGRIAFVDGDLKIGSRIEQG
jgi:hypothetical protein